MASIVGKKQGGRTYYYLVESARVDGKPRIVSQRYLGSATEIAARLAEQSPGEPDRTRHLAFGAVAAVWSVLGRLKVAEIVDDVVGGRRSDAGASIGTYIALATLNRVVDPCSKLGFSDPNIAAGSPDGADCRFPGRDDGVEHPNGDHSAYR